MAAVNRSSGLLGSNGNAPLFVRKNGKETIAQQVKDNRAMVQDLALPRIFESTSREPASKRHAPDPDAAVHLDSQETILDVEEVTNADKYTASQLSINPDVLKTAFEQFSKDTPIDPFEFSSLERSIKEAEIFLDKFFTERRKVPWRNCIGTSRDGRYDLFRWENQILAKVEREGSQYVENETIRFAVISYLRNHPIYCLEFNQIESRPTNALYRYISDKGFRPDSLGGVSYCDADFRTTYHCEMSLEGNFLCTGQGDRSDSAKQDAAKTILQALHNTSAKRYLIGISKQHIVAYLPVQGVANIAADYLDGDYLYLEPMSQEYLKIRSRFDKALEELQTLPPPAED